MLQIKSTLTPLFFDDDDFYLFFQIYSKCLSELGGSSGQNASVRACEDCFGRFLPMSSSQFTDVLRGGGRVGRDK